MSNVLIKHEMEWLVEDSYAPDLANQAEELDMEFQRSIKTKENVSYTAVTADVVQEFDPVPQTDEFIKIELILDEEFRDKMSDSEENCKQIVLASTEEKHAKVTKSAQEVCWSSATQKANLKIHTQHLEKSRSIIPFECAFCSRTFKKKHYLKGHLMTHVTNRKPEFACDICERAYYSKAALVRHMRTYAQKDHPKFECEVCWSTFTRKGHLDLHMSTKHSDQSQPNTHAAQPAASYGQASAESAALPSKSEACEICHCIFPTEYMRMHMRFAHSKPKYKCKICSRTCKTKNILKNHLKLHDKDRKREFACNSCASTFYSSSTLWTHKKMVHNQETYHCRVCDQHLKNEESLKVHMLRRQHFDESQKFTTQASNDAGVPMKTELPSDEEEEFIEEREDQDSVSHADIEQLVKDGKAEENVSCGVCRNSYPAELIETHMRITHGDRTFKCHLCPLICLREAILKNHIRSHADKGKDTRHYACELCGHKFLCKKSVKRHMATQHTKNRLPAFNCELCEKQFYNKTGLNYHMNVHNGVTFSCEVCEARFTQVQSLKTHILRKHSGNTEQCTLDPPAANEDSFHTKEELTSDQEFLDEGT